MLWIAFKLYLWNIENSLLQRHTWDGSVVNCFQIVSLKYWEQLKKEFELRKESLWIAFKLYLWNIENSFETIWLRLCGVVNCFQIVSLKYWEQHWSENPFTPACCELLSNCIFEILRTARGLSDRRTWPLWIAFKLYLWNIENSTTIYFNPSSDVVNCFQIVSLKYWEQRSFKYSLTDFCCELLSNCIFEILRTAINRYRGKTILLWIAFKLYLWNIENSWTFKFG